MSPKHSALSCVINCIIFRFLVFKKLYAYFQLLSSTGKRNLYKVIVLTMMHTTLTMAQNSAFGLYLHLHLHLSNLQLANEETEPWRSLLTNTR